MSKPTSLKVWKESAKKNDWWGVSYSIRRYRDKLVMCDCCGEAFVLLTQTNFSDVYVTPWMCEDRLVRIDLGLDSCAVQTDEYGKEHICFHCWMHAR